MYDDIKAEDAQADYCDLTRFRIILYVLYSRAEVSANDEVVMHNKEGQLLIA